MKQVLKLKSGAILELYNSLLRVKTEDKIYSFTILNNLENLQVFFKTCNALKENNLDILIKMSKHKLFFELQGCHIVECYYSTI